MALNPEISLKRYSWNSRNKIIVTGSCWLNGIFTENEPFISEIERNIADFDSFADFCDRLNGQFSIIVQKEYEVWLHTCHTWSYPLFYKVSAEYKGISDIPENLLDKDYNPVTTERIAAYYKTFAVTPGSTTLDKDIQVVRPNEIIAVDLISGEIKSRYRQVSVKTSSATDDKSLASLFRSSFLKYANYFRGKQVLLPLTKGYDSRLIACLLKENQIENVICSTWGRPGNVEVETAQKVAGTLGYRHVFVPYNHQLISSFPHSEEFHEYAAMAGHFTSMPYLQDYFAVKYLLENRIINHETIVLAGHPGDLLRGSHLYPHIENDSKNRLAKEIMYAFGYTLPLSSRQKRMVISEIKNNIFSNESNNRQSLDHFDYQERLCKFFANSSQVYTFFNISYLSPLFDKELLRFMLALPEHQRMFAALYNQTLETHFFTPLNVAFTLKEKEPGLRTKKPLKEWLIKNSPAFIREKFYPLEDDIFYHEITSLLRSSYSSYTWRKPVKPNRFNAYLIQWYFNRLKCTIEK